MRAEESALWVAARRSAGGALSNGTATATNFPINSYGRNMKALPRRSAALLLAALLFASSPLHAQDREDYRVRIGLGAQLQPEFFGADGTEVRPLVDVDVARGDNPFGFEVPGDSFGIPLVSSKGFRAGPAANIAGSRKNKDVGAPVGKVSTTFELGAFAEYLAGENFRLRGELLKGVGGHEGLVGSIGGDAIMRDGDNYVVSVGPRLMFSDGRYQRAFFGVDSEAALATGLAPYRPGSGVHGVGLVSGVTYQFSPRFGLFGFGSYERLVGDAAKSPIIREFGSRNQFSAGAGLSYTFTVRR
jgi:outer membrane protein